MVDEKENLQRQTWNLGELIKLRVESTLYDGTFNCQVIGINLREGILQVSFPKSQGKLVLLPVRTIVQVVRKSERFYSEKYTVIDRTSGEKRCLVLQQVVNKKNEFINFDPPKDVRVITVCSGKGGVGKTTLAINMAFALAAKKKKVCILDGALGNANVDILLDITPRYNLAHVVTGQCRLIETLVEVSNGVYILPGCSGLQMLTELTEYEYNHLGRELRAVCEYFDILLIDTMAGISRNVTNFVLAAENGCLVTTSEPHSVTDTYALLKVLVRHQTKPLDISLVVNRVELKVEAEDTAKKLQFAAKKFLSFDLGYAGYIIEDYRVRQGNGQQKPVIQVEPTALVSSCFRNIGDAFLYDSLGKFQENKELGKGLHKIKNS